jgi:hypothetical protein
MTACGREQRLKIGTEIDPERVALIGLPYRKRSPNRFYYGVVQATPSVQCPTCDESSNNGKEWLLMMDIS